MNKRVQILSFAWMLGIVLYHAGAGGCSRFYNVLISDFRVGGVVFFYAVSGFFLMKHFKGDIGSWWMSAVLKRVRTLVVPYFIWCSLGVQGYDFLRQYGLSSLGPVANPPLWYVKFLFLFCLASPLILVSIQCLNRKKAFLPVMLASVIILPCIPLPLKFCMFLSLLMFSFGVGLALLGEEERRSLESRTMVFAGLCVWAAGLAMRALIPDMSLQMKWAINVYSALSLAVAMWGLCKVDGSVRVVPCFRITFFIYCMHGILLRHFRILGYPPADGVLVLITCVVVGMLVSRFAPLLYKILTGNR